ncbi:MAG: nucleotidyltransferase family protein [Acidobacteria bacterium]|nr:nucleotidyltransferase family protein [Acidobacteriota bacterium]MYD70193.1 nucleotidyltransferase family protein [Acidobacteriota bacterium]MYJ05782.1 nucleotidyltransferase family protein [Acidobacteriota bacterium]
MTVPGVVLAAGRSSRMGRPKALLPAGGGETFLSRIVRALREGGVREVVVVASGDGPLREIRSALAPLSPEKAASPVVAPMSGTHPPARVVLNPDPSRGQLSSLLCGLEAIDRPDVAAMLLTLVDIPLVEPGTVRALLDAYARTCAPVVRPVRADPAIGETPRTHGHPVILDRALFDPLRAADPAQGAKPVVRACEDRAITVPVPGDGAFIDIDTPEAYQRVFGSVIE